MSMQISGENQAQVTENIEFRHFYFNTATLLKRLEGLDPVKIIKNLIEYLRLLASDGSDGLLKIYNEHRVKPYSWIQQAELIASINTYLDEIDKFKQLAHLQAHELDFLNEAETQINYFHEQVVAGNAAKLEELYNALVTCMSVDELLEYRDEIREFLGAENITVIEATPEQLAEKAHRLLGAGMISCFRQQFDHVKRYTVQTKFLLERLQRFVGDFQDTAMIRISDHAEITDQLNAARDEHSLSMLAEQIESAVSAEFGKVQQQIIQMDIFVDVAREAAASLMNICGDMRKFVSEKVANRFSNKLAAINSQNFFDQLSVDSKHAIQPLRQWIKMTEEVAGQVEVRREELVILKEKEQVYLAQQRMHEFESVLEDAEPGIEKADELISFAKLKLSCAATAKECFGRYSMGSIFKSVTSNLVFVRNELLRIQQTLNADINWSVLKISADDVEQLSSRKAALLAKVTNKVNDVSGYIDTIGYSEGSFPAEELAKWQVALTNLFEGATRDELEHYHEQILKIVKLQNKYLRALLIMYFGVVHDKLTDAIQLNIQSWHIRNVSEYTITNTFKYLGITVSDESLLKIAPHLAHYRKLYNRRVSAVISRVNEFVSQLFETLNVFKKA